MTEGFEFSPHADGKLTIKGWYTQITWNTNKSFNQPINGKLDNNQFEFTTFQVMQLVQFSWHYELPTDHTSHMTGS